MIQLNKLEICPYCYAEVRMLISENEYDQDITCPACQRVL